MTIAANTTTAEFTVSVTGDETDEFDETFNVTISLPSDVTAAAILGGDSATVTGTIIDDDLVQVTIAAKTPTVEEGEDAVFTLTRSGDASEELLITFVYRGDGTQETLNATFEPGSSTSEVSRTTVDDALVNYPPDRPYEAVLLGDSFGASVENRVWSPGTPASATVTVTDNDVLATVTVHAQQAFATERGPIRAIFRRTGGNISLPLTIDYLQFFLRNDAETQFGVFEQITFPANQAEVTSSDFTAGLLAGDNIINLVPNSGDLYVPWTLTTVIYGDGGPNGFHRSWEAGIPNTASTVLYDDDVTQGLELHAQYSHRAARGDQVTITFTVMNTGTVTTGSPITITSVQRDDNDSDLDGQPESRVGCTITSAISVGASASCTATFTIGQTDFENTPLELDATASDSTATSKPFRIYITILDGILVGFRETDALQITEGASSIANLVVTRDGSLEEEVQVAYITRPFEGYNPNAALEGDDYTDTSATPGTITFGANQAEATISLNILQDGLFENRERFEVVLQAPDGVAIAEGKGIRRVVIVDFRSLNYRPVATLHRIGEQSVMEDAGSVEFAVRLTHAARQLLRYDVSLDPGVRGARAGADFVDPTMTVALAPGELEQTFTVALIDDNEVEDPEDFRVRMTGHIRNPNPSWATLATPTTARVTIVDDDLVEPSEVRLVLTWGRNNSRRLITEATTRQDITVTASFHTETPAGTSRTFVPFTEDTTVRVQFDDPASSADPTDFQAFGVLEVVIAAGQTSGSSTLQFRPVDDDIDEDTELVTLAGSVVTNSSVDSSLPVVPASVALADNDTRGITVTPGFVMNLMEEGDSGAYTVVLDSQPTETVTIGLQLDEIGQLNVSTKTLTFDADNWNVLQTVTVWAEDDGIIEVNQSESIEHEVSGGDYDQFTLETVVVSITDTTVAYVHLEGARVLESSGNLEFTIRISPPQPTSAVTVQYSTADGTATGGSDYTSFNGSTLSIPLGQDSATIAIPITNDNLDEADVETFTLRLTLPTAATLTGGVTELTATGSIVDDDDTPVLTISGPDGALSYVAEDTSVPVTFTLSLSGGSSEDVTLDYATGLATGDISARSGLGRATEGDDYIAASGVVTFLPGEKAKTITVQVQDDHISEGTEFFGLNLSNLRNAEFTNQQTKESASVGILDNDTRSVVISRSRIVLEEPTQGATATTDSYTVVLTSQPTATATVAVDAASDPAVSLDKTSLTFTALTWNTPQTVTITPVRDADAIDEFVTVSHTVTGGDYEGLRADDVGVRVDDSDARDVIVSKSTLPLTEGNDDTYTVELASQPTATTTVSISVAGDAQLTIDPTELTFTTSSWNTPQTITVTATHDDDASDSTATLTHVAGGSDYVSVTKTVSVTVTDDDPDVTVSFGAMSYTVAEGDMVSVTVTLSAAPGREVEIPITATDRGGATSPADYTGVPASVTFGPTETEQTITFRATQDDEDDDGESVLLALGTPLPAGVTAGTTAATTVTITDDDTPGVLVSRASLTIAEGGSGTYTIVLDSEPTATVTVTINDPTDNTDVTADQASLTFSPTDWSMPQTVTVRAAHDNDTSNETATVTHNVTSSDSSYSSASANSVAVTVTDDDPDVTVSFGAMSYTVAEGDMVSVTVTLSAAPGREIEIPIARTNQGASDSDYTGVPASVTFSPTETEQTITFRATQDEEDDDERVLLAFGTPLPTGVTAGTPATTTVTITDDDTAGVSVSNDSLTIVEGSSGTYTIVLDSEPTATVTVTINDPTDNTDVTADQASLTFSPTDWSMPQTVTVRAAHDNDTSNETATVTHSVTSSDSSYSSASANSVAVTVTDDDPDVTVSFGAMSYTVAEGDPVTVTVSLDLAPGREVEIPITATDRGGATSPADYTGVPASVTFGPTETEQTITFRATQDDEDDDGESVLLALGTPLPAGVTAGTTAATTVTITDDDTPGVSVSRASLTIAEGGSGTYTIVLDSEPTATVTVTINDPTDNTDVTADMVSLTFSPTDWSMPQTVTVRAAHDNDTSNETATVTHSVTSSDSSYSSASADSVAVTVTDDDPDVTVSFGAMSYTVAEGDMVSVTVTLSAAPGREVTIPITRTNQGASDSDYTGVPASVTFSPTETEQTITFRATQDEEDDDGEKVLLGFGTPLPAGVTAGTTAATTVTITDDDTAGVSVSNDSLTIVEGSSGTYTIVLDSEPTATVTVTINDPTDNTDVTADQASLTFSPTDWSMPQTVTVRAAHDNDTSNETATVTHSVTSSDSSYSSASADSVAVTVTDDDPDVTVSFGAMSYTVAEGDPVSVTVTLSAAPGREVVIPITKENLDGATPADYSGVPRSLKFNAGQTEQTFTFSATQDEEDDDDEKVLLGFGTNLPSGVSDGAIAKTTVSITDDDEPQGREPASIPDRRGTVVTIERVPIGTVIPDNSSLTVGATVVENSTFLEGTQALFRLKFEAVGGGPPVGDGVDVDLRFSWHIPSPLVTAHGYHGYATQATFSLHRVDVWDTAVPIHDNDFGHPGGTLTIRIIGCERSGCIIGTPSQITLTIVDDDGGPEAAVPGPPDLPSLVCARSGDGYDDTGIAVSWKAPNFVGGAAVESYELRYRESSRFDEVAGKLIEHTWESWPHGVAATYATLTGLVTRANYTVEVRAVSGNGPGLWSKANYFRVGPMHEICEIIDQLTPQPLNPPPPDSAQQSLSNAPAKGEPRIAGIPEVGQTLSADTTAIADANGLEEVVFQYQWLAEDADIASATSGTYTVAPGDAGKAIMVRVAFTDDARHEETLTSAPTAVVTAAGLQLQSATVDGATLTLTYNEDLDTGVTLGTTPFAVSVNGSSRPLIGVGVGESNVLLLLSSAVEAGDTVTVDYTAPGGPDFIRDTRGRKAASFSGHAVTNNTASAPDDTTSDPLTASVHNVPSSHNGQDAFTFELRFSKDPRPDFSYTTVRDHAFTVTGGSVTYVLRLEPGKNVRWEITVTPSSSAAVAIALNATTACSAQGAICTEDSGMLSGGLLLVVPGPNTPATGAPTITGAAQVGETLTADSTGISDDDGLGNAAFAYQWFAADAEINRATASIYTLVAANAGEAIKVRVSFTDDAGNDEELTSAATGAVAAAVVTPPLTASVHNMPSSHNGQDAFTFELRFSEDPRPDFSYTTVRDHAFTVTGGSVTYVLRLEPGKNVRWEITVTPSSSAAVAIALNATTACSAQGAICTEDDRKLSGGLERTVNGPGQ